MIALVNVLPLGKGQSLSKLVSEAVDEVCKSGLDYRLTAMGTIIEGEWDEVLRLVKRMRDRVARKSPRVYLTLAIDDRKSRARRINSKVKSVETALSKSLRK